MSLTPSGKRYVLWSCKTGKITRARKTKVQVVNYCQACYKTAITLPSDDVYEKVYRWCWQRDHHRAKSEDEDEGRDELEEGETRDGEGSAGDEDCEASTTITRTTSTTSTTSTTTTSTSSIKVEREKTKEEAKMGKRDKEYRDKDKDKDNKSNPKPPPEKRERGEVEETGKVEKRPRISHPEEEVDVALLERLCKEMYGHMSGDMQRDMERHYTDKLRKFEQRALKQLETYVKLCAQLASRITKLEAQVQDFEEWHMTAAQKLQCIEANQHALNRCPFLWDMQTRAAMSIPRT